MNESAADVKAALLAELDSNPESVITTYRKGKVLDTLDADPKHRKSLRTMVADKFPGTAEMMPETAVERAVAPALLELQQERAKLAEERLKDQQKKNHAEWLASLRAEGIAESDLPAVQQLAQDTANLDPKALALRFKAQNTPARSTARFGRPILPGGGQDAFFAGIQDNPDAWLDNRAHILWDAEANGRNVDNIDWSKEVIA